MSFASFPVGGRDRHGGGGVEPVLHAAARWLPLTQTWMHTQLRRLPDRFESHVVCGVVENRDLYPVPNLHSLADSPLRWHWDRVLSATRMRRQLAHHTVQVAREVGARLVHSHFGPVGWRNAAAVRRGGMAHVVTFYGQDATMLPQREPKWRVRYERMFADVDAVLAEGRHLARTIEALGCPREKLVVHHLGVELEHLPFVPRRRSRHEPLRVLVAGMFTEKKGIPDAIDALARLRGLGRGELAITLVGDATPEPRRLAEKARIEAAIARSGLDIRRPGFLTHEALLREAYEHDVFLSPSVVASDGDAEGGAPVTILEFAATGMPVISTRHCDIPEVLGPGGDRLLVDEHDTDGLVECLVHVADEPDEVRASARRVRAHVETEYDAVRQGDRLGAIYDDALARAGLAGPLVPKIRSVS